VSVFERTVFIWFALAFSWRGRAGLRGERGRLLWSDIPRAGRVQLVRVVKQRLRAQVLEARMMRELLDVDDLTINGKVVWKKKPPQRGFHARNRK